MKKATEKEKMEGFSDVLIVGTGIAGLSAALLLQHSGVQVTVIEAHDKPGGCAGYFSAGDWTFPTGATALLGFETGGLHRQIFEMIGASLPQFSDINGLRVVLPDREIFMAHDQKIWEAERRKLSGNHVRQEVFWRLQEIVADAGWRSLQRWPSLPLQLWEDIRRNMALVDPRLWSLLPAQCLTVGEVMRVLNIHRDRSFRALVELSLIITTQSSARQSPFLNGAAGLDLWRHGAFHLEGGAGEIARCMAELFIERGGQICFGTRAVLVERIGTRWKTVTTRGEQWSCSIGWNGGLQSLESVMRDQIQRPHLKEDVVRGGEQWGAVNLYCALAEEGVPSGCGLHTQVLNTYSAKSGDGDDVFLSLSSEDDQKQAPQGWRALNVSTHTRLKEWRDLDAKEYRAQKRWWREKLLEGVRRAIPSFDEHAKFVICGTPSTWERYTHRAQGGVGGFSLTRRNANLLAISGRVAPGMWRIGDSVFPGQGTVAAALSGLNFWRDVTGK